MGGVNFMLFSLLRSGMYLKIDSCTSIWCIRIDSFILLVEVSFKNIVIKRTFTR